MGTAKDVHAMAWGSLGALAFASILGCGGTPQKQAAAVSATPTPVESVACPTASVATAKAALADAFERWKDARQLAHATPVMSLTGPITTLQELKRDTERIPVPPCLNGARYWLVTNMEDEIAAMMFLLANPDQSGGAATLVAEVTEHEGDYRKIVEAVEKCAPNNCQPLVDWRPGPDGPISMPKIIGRDMASEARIDRMTRELGLSTDDPVIDAAVAEVVASTNSAARFMWHVVVSNPTGRELSFTLFVDLNGEALSKIGEGRVGLSLQSGERQTITRDSVVPMPDAARVQSIRAWTRKST